MAGNWGTYFGKALNVKTKKRRQLTEKNEQREGQGPRKTGVPGCVSDRLYLK